MLGINGALVVLDGRLVPGVLELLPGLKQPVLERLDHLFVACFPTAGNPLYDDLEVADVLDRNLNVVDDGTA